MGEKKVVFIGGAHGSGKTTICSLLKNFYNIPVIKQRRLLMEVGLDRGLNWPEVAKYHFDLITEAAQKALDFFLYHDCVLVDCHYAIRRDKALRPMDQNIWEGYIHDLDPLFVECLTGVAKPVFVLIAVSPEVAATRLSLSREAKEYEYSVQGNALQARAEQFFFLNMVRKFSCARSVVMESLGGQCELAKKIISLKVV